VICGSHERYREIFGLVRERDGQLAAAFDDPRRSAALFQLLHIRTPGLLIE
jgi:hypothetical protein